MKVSSPDKLIYPADGVTKADVVAHYQAVGERMMDFLAGRPLTLQRFPRGIDAVGFMQKNAANHFPDSIRRHPVPKREGGHTVYPVVDHAVDLAYLANQNTVTFHMWTSTVDQPGHPDWMVIDLDPEDGDVEKVRVATGVVREVLSEFDVLGIPVATGSKGFHVWVPLDGTLGYDRVAVAARAIAGLAVTVDPHRLTTEFLKKNRGGRVFVDWLRSAPTATVVVPFSLRPRPGAPVAVPMRWDELPTAEPTGWTIHDLGDRLAVDTALSPQTLPVDDIVSAARSGGVDLDTPHDRFGRER
ncbi:MAG: non-homologous end-joining DNA ligase [Acidimicrobiales bacterium]